MITSFGSLRRGSNSEFAAAGGPSIGHRSIDMALDGTHGQGESLHNRVVEQPSTIKHHDRWRSVNGTCSTPFRAADEDCGPDRHRVSREYRQQKA
jgi:hypothetical protein